jgi:hypothetical protein
MNASRERSARYGYSARGTGRPQTDAEVVDRVKKHTDVDFVRLCHAIGAKPCGSGIESDAERWVIYQKTISTLESLDLLLAAIASEGNTALASATVVAVIEQRADQEPENWIRLLPADVRVFPRVRANEVERLRQLMAGSTASPDEIDGWTDWLQRRASTRPIDVEVLSLLAKCGRTKRVRNAAREQLDAARRRA